MSDYIPNMCPLVLLDLVGQLHVLWMVLQAGDKLLHRVLLKADLIDGIEKGKPEMGRN